MFKKKVKLELTVEDGILIPSQITSVKLLADMENCIAMIVIETKEETIDINCKNLSEAKKTMALLKKHIINNEALLVSDINKEDEEK